MYQIMVLVASVSGVLVEEGKEEEPGDKAEGGFDVVVVETEVG